jgi:hypothetical protein
MFILLSHTSVLSLGQCWNPQNITYIQWKLSVKPKLPQAPQGQIAKKTSIVKSTIGYKAAEI